MADSYTGNHNLMISAQSPSLIAQFFAQAERLADQPFLWAKRDGSWKPTTWRQAADQTRFLARGLRRLGLSPGDRVVLVAENRPEWLIADHAIMAAGGVTVPAYTTNGPNDHHHVLTDSGARMVIVSTAALAAKVLPAVLRAPTVEHVIAIEPLRHGQNDGFQLHQWGTVVAQGAAHKEIPLVEPQRTDLACLIYTSGTGGAPKGVMLSHGAILHNCEAAHDVLNELGIKDEVFLSFLPLSHSYEHTAGQFVPVTLGAQIYYAEGIDALASNLIETRPTLMTAVPRLYETLQNRIMRGVERGQPRARKLFLRTVELGRKRITGKLSLLERIEDFFLTLLVRRKVRARFGGRLKAMVSGGAPLNPEVGMFFLALGVRILQGYGQTESAPLISVNRPRKIKIATVGPPVKAVEVKLAEDGEILARGELVMQGYWRQERATQEAIRDGWLHTGDIGVFDADGYLTITDRKKDIIVNSGGDNIAPQRVEGFLTLEPEITQAMVYGDKRPYLVALLVPDELAAADWAKKNGKEADLDGLRTDPAFREFLAAAVARVNANLSIIERVRHFIIADEPFTTVNGEMTPTLKIRRHVLKQRYAERLEALYR
jgi:long-chain acyl-CoA synthetase